MNKVKKRILCMLLCVVLLASLLPAAFADDTVTTDDVAEVGNTVKFSYTAGKDFANAGAITVNFKFDPTELQLVSVTASPISGVSAVSFGSADIATANTNGIFGACWVDPNLSMNAAATDVLLEANFKALKADSPSIKVEEATFHSVSEGDMSQVKEVLTDAEVLQKSVQESIIEIITRLAGDVNDDGKVNGKDYILLSQFLADWDVTINENNSNVNGDTKVNGKDAIRLAQFLADWDVTLD